MHPDPAWTHTPSDALVALVYLLIPFLLVLGLQILHRRLLLRILPDACRRWIPWGLLAVHAPLVVYLGLRFGGFDEARPGPVLTALARGGLYFQILTIVNFAFSALALGAWTLRRRIRGTPDPGPLDPGRRAFLRNTAAGGLGVLVITGAKGAEEAYGAPETTRRELWFPDLPQGLDGLRVLHLSDLHCGPLVGANLVRRWRSLAEREGADLVLVTGDLVDSRPEEIAPFAEIFRDFPARLGRFAVLGNHDYFTDPRPIWEGLEGAGYKCLENRHALVERNGARLALLGLQDPMASYGRFMGVRFGPGPLPQEAQAGIPDGSWRLCLCHRPGDWDLARETGARLTLSGHTHGGQINLIPGVSSAHMLGPYTSGLYRRHGQSLYVSRGLGVVGLPMRIGAPPELAVLTLRRKEIPSVLPRTSLVSSPFAP